MKEDELWDKAYECADTQGEVCSGVGIGKKHHDGELFDEGDYYQHSGAFEPWTCMNDEEGL